MAPTESSQAAHGFDGHDIGSAVLSLLNHQDRKIRARVIEDAAVSADPELLVNLVGDGTNAVRRNAAMDALARGGARSVPALVRALRESDTEIVMFAATLLGKTRDRSVIPHLVALLDHRDVNVVQAAVESLGQLRAIAAVDPLLRLLAADPWLRLGAIHALGEIGDGRAADPLAAALADADVWELAVSALGKVRSLRAVGHLADALFASAGGPGFPVSLRALGEALRRHPAPEPLWELRPWVRLASATAAPLHQRLATLLEEAAGPYDNSDRERLAMLEAAAMLVRGLRLESLYTPLLRSARNSALAPSLQFWALAIGSDLSDALAQGLVDADPGVRDLSCRCAGALRSAVLSDSITDCVRDPDARVRESAVLALSRIGGPETVAALAERLLDDAPGVRAAAQAALAGLDPEVASDALLAFPHRDPAVATVMLQVMRGNPHPSQLPFLFDCLTHPDAGVRSRAVEAVGEQREIDHVELLGPLLQDGDVTVESATIRVLGRRRTARSSSVLFAQLERDAAKAGVIVQALMDLGEAATGAQLIDVYQRRPGRDSVAILQALAERGEPLAEPLLVNLLGDDDAELRGIAVKALACFGDVVALHHIVAAATDPAWPVRANVAEVLGQLGYPEAIAELERLCLDEHPLVAMTARHRLELLQPDSGAA